LKEPIQSSGSFMILGSKDPVVGSMTTLLGSREIV